MSELDGVRLDFFLDGGSLHSGDLHQPRSSHDRPFPRDGPFPHDVGRGSARDPWEAVLARLAALSDVFVLR